MFYEKLKYINKEQSTITHKISETKPKFISQIAHDRKSLISVFQEIFASIVQTFILASRLDIRLSFSET